MNMRKNLTAVATCALLVLPFAVRADNLDYNYVQGEYDHIGDPASDGLSSDHAYGLDASWALPANFLVLGSYSHESADTTFPGESVSGNSYSLGLGYRFPLSDSWDLVPSLSYDSQRASASGPVALATNSVTFNGYDVMLKARGMLTDSLELDPGYDFSKVNGNGESLTTNTLLLHAFYHFTPNFALGLGYENATNGGSATNTWKLMARYSFR